MKAVVIARQESVMRWLDNGVSCVPDVFGVESPIKREALIIGNFIAQWVITTDEDDQGL